MTKEERKQKALEIKGDRKIYFSREPDAPEEFGLGIVVAIADLSIMMEVSGLFPTALQIGFMT